MSLSLPIDKRDNIYKLVNRFYKLPMCTIRDFAKLIGVLIAACPAVKYGWMYTKLLERQKYLFLCKYKNYDVRVKLPKIIQKDLKWCISNIYITYNNIQSNQNYLLEIFTDVSRSGWDP